MLGYTQEELIGRFCADFVDDAWLDKGQAEWEARRAGRSNRYEIKMKRKDGTGIWVRVGGAPVVDGKGEYTNILAAFANIAAQKTAQEELRRSQKQALKLVAELEKADLNKNEMISMLYHVCGILATSQVPPSFWSCWSAVMNGLAVLSISLSANRSN